MKRIVFYLAIILITAVSCNKFENEVPQPVIDLGAKALATEVKSIKQEGNNITAVFATTPGAKYSIQIMELGNDTPLKKEGFTATSEETIKTLDISSLPKNQYDFLFINTSGEEVKYPVSKK
jgi:hypothetical protein